MKKFIFAGVLLSLIFCTSGCVKTSYNIEVDKKNNITVSETDSYNQKLFKSMAKDQKAIADLAEIEKQLEKDKEDLKSQGFKVTDYENDGFVGLTASKEYPKNSLKESDLPVGFIPADKSPLTVDKGFFKTYYSIRLVYNPEKVINENAKNYLPSEKLSNKNDTPSEISETSEVNETETNENDYAEETMPSQPDNGYKEFLDNLFDASPDLKPSVDLTIKIPYKATKNNATKVISEYEYYWKLKDKELNSINISYEKYNYGNIVLLIILLIVSIFAGINYKKFMNTSSW